MKIQDGKFVIYTDGSCLGNPGRGGWSVVSGDTAMSGGYRLTTNNRMEVLAAIRALETLPEGSDVVLHSDSQYLCNAINKGWLGNWQRKGWRKSDGKKVLNRDLWERLLPQLGRHRVEFVWVRGHAGNADNEMCDALARKAAGNARDVDLVFEREPD